jgi:hypothetical protein
MSRSTLDETSTSFQAAQKSRISGWDSYPINLVGDYLDWTSQNAAKVNHWFKDPGPAYVTDGLTKVHVVTLPREGEPLQRKFFTDDADLLRYLSATVSRLLMLERLGLSMC